MCGIAGFIAEGFTAEAMARVARRMAGALRHRGPDGGGVWVDAAAGVALAQRRLAILDLSPTGAQPMRSVRGRYTVVFNGEIYNHRHLRRELVSLGQRFRGTSDTETMLAAFSEWGVRASLERFNGMFAFAVWDGLERRLYLARDRAGEKPLYYARRGGTFLFASELKALLEHPRFSPEIDRDALALYLRHSYVPAPYSVYCGVRKLPPGTWLAVDGGETAPLEYWSAREAAERGLAEPFEGSDAEAAAELEALLGDAVRLRMEADVPLGAFLSGGVDSSTVVALMQAASSRPVRTFTVGFLESGYDEAADARRVARHLGTDHTELYLTPSEALDVIPRLPALYDEPFADSSQIPTFLVSELARRHVTVSLSGDGGDELFGGYNRYLWAERIWRRTGRLPPRLKRLAAAALTALPAARWDRIFAGLASWRQRTPGGKLHKLAEAIDAGSPEDLYQALVSQWKDPARVVRGGVEPDVARMAPPFPDLARRMMYLDAVTYLPDDILVKLDRASMGVSLEGRVPLLDHRIIEFALRLPAHFKIRRGQGKWLLRQVLYKHVPRELIERPKMGFAVPIGDWLRGPLRDWAEELLDPRRLRDQGFLDPAPIREKWGEHLAGRREWQHSLWSVLMFQFWLEETRRGVGTSPALVGVES